MTYDDKIVRGGEILETTTFESPSGAFCLMLAPKTETASDIAILDVKLSQNDESLEYPFTVGTWNPIVVNSITVTEDNLTNYRIFWGETL